MAAVLKTVERKFRGFESLPLRHLSERDSSNTGSTFAQACRPSGTKMVVNGVHVADRRERAGR